MFVYQVLLTLLTFIKISARDYQLYMLITMCCIEFVQLSPLCYLHKSWFMNHIVSESVSVVCVQDNHFGEHFLDC